MSAYKVFDLEPGNSSENFLAMVVLSLFKVPTTDNFYITVSCHGCRCLRMTKKKKLEWQDDISWVIIMAFILPIEGQCILGNISFMYWYGNF